MKTIKTRINQLDIMRGFALLGILTMNIISFGLPEAHYFNPHAEGVLHGWNQGALVVSELFANEKFMGLFSLLFGASVVLFTDKVEGKGRSAWAFHMRRNGWLLVFGMLHAYLLWVGDILVTYAICSVWLFFFRKWSARNLFIASGASVLLLLSMDAMMGWSVPYWTEAEVAGFAEFWTPSSAAIAQEVAAMRGTWVDQMTVRVPGAMALQTEYLPMLALRATAMMLLGMGLYKAGVLNGRGRRWNGGLALVGLTVGLAITGWGFHYSQTHEWAMEVFFDGGSSEAWGWCSSYWAMWGASLAMRRRSKAWAGAVACSRGKNGIDQLPRANRHLHHLDVRPRLWDVRDVGSCAVVAVISPFGLCRSSRRIGGWSATLLARSSGHGDRLPIGVFSR